MKSQSKLVRVAPFATPGRPIDPRVNQRDANGQPVAKYYTHVNKSRTTWPGGPLRDQTKTSFFP